MREQLERVIAELEEEANKTNRDKKRLYRDDPYMIGVMEGRYTIATIAMNKLKEVLSNAPDHPNRGDTAKPEHHT